MKDQALEQARQYGRTHGRTDFNAKGYVGVVDVVDECPSVGQWLDTLTADPHQFNEAHAQVWQAYSAGYTEGLRT
jgi:hypothetical protein